MRVKPVSELKKILIQAGLSRNESQVYLRLLESGNLPAAKLAELTGLSRQNTYNVIASLQEKGFCSAIREGSRQIFCPSNPDTIRQSLAEQGARLRSAADLLEKNFEHFMKHYNLTQGEEGSYQFEGIDGLRLVYDSLLSDGLSIYSFQNRALLRERLEELNNNWLKSRRKLRLWNYIISPDGGASLNKNDTDDRLNYRQVKYLPRKAFPFEIDLKTNGKRVVITSFKDEKTKGIVISDPLVASNFSLIFNLVWDLI